MYKGKKVIAITGGYNEEGKIGWVIKRMPKFVDKILVIDDGSTDEMVEEAIRCGKGKNLTILKNKARRGVGYVLKRGMKYAIFKNFDIVIHVPGDAQDDPREILKLLKAIEKGADIAQGSRYLKKGVKIPIFRKITSKLYTFFFKIITGFPITDAVNGFRAYRIEIAKKIDFSPSWLNSYELEPYMLIQAIKMGYKIKEVPVIKRYHKTKGYSKMRPLIDWFRITIPLWREIFKF